MSLETAVYLSTFVTSVEVSCTVAWHIYNVWYRKSAQRCMKIANSTQYNIIIVIYNRCQNKPT